MLSSYLEKISGINSVLRGKPESNTMSGKAMSLISSMAIQYASNYEKSYSSLYKQLGQVTLNVLKHNLTIQKSYEILGEDGRLFKSNLESSHIHENYNVQVELAHPLTRTTQGRLGIAELMIENGYSISPENLLHLLTTGTFKKEVFGKLSEDETIFNENKALISGNENVRALTIDNHPKHIQSHRNILNTNATRTNPEILSRTYEHIKQHLFAWEQLSHKEPSLLKIYNIPPYIAGNVSSFPDENEKNKSPSNPYAL